MMSLPDTNHSSAPKWAALFGRGGFLFVYGNDQIADRPDLFSGRLNIVVIHLNRRIDIVQRALNPF